MAGSRLFAANSMTCLRLSTVSVSETIRMASGRERVISTKAFPKSFGSRTPNVWTLTSRTLAAASAARERKVMPRSAALNSIATIFMCGTASLRISRRLALSSVASSVTPVRLPPGRARLWAKPVATGSPAPLQTMGTSFANVFAANEAGYPNVMITSTLAAFSASTFSDKESPQRGSKRRLRPSTKSSAANTSMIALRRSSPSPIGRFARSPTRYVLACCCARAASGQAALAQQPAMNSRRLMARLNFGQTFSSP